MHTCSNSASEKAGDSSFHDFQTGGFLSHTHDNHAPLVTGIHAQLREERSYPVSTNHLHRDIHGFNHYVGQIITGQNRQFLECLSLSQVGYHFNYRTCKRAAGCRASAMHLIRLGRLHLRPFLRWLHSLKIPSSQRNRK